jgi:5-methylcytosine-specific restriction protein B
MAKITIGGRQYEVERKQVIKAIKDKEPRLIKSYYMEVEGKQYPIKQVVELTLKIPAIAFTSMDAYRLLVKLGFEIYSTEA